MMSETSRKKYKLTKSIIDSSKLSNEQLTKIYSDINVSFIENNPENQKQLVEKTYGEILYDSVEELIKQLGINSSDVFYDLGSGTGKLVMQVYANTPVNKAYGIEFFQDRSYAAEKALKRMYVIAPHLLNTDRLISHQIQNIKDVHYMDNATIIFMCSTCFPSALMEIVYNKIKNNQNLRHIITTETKTHDDFKKILPNTKIITLPCTWSKEVRWIIYSK